jgi:hypothetical protein
MILAGNVDKNKKIIVDEFDNQIVFRNEAVTAE